jgi:sugar (pentulose or hexulose) kinase
MAEPSFSLLGLDLGTTHCKAGLFSSDGGLIRASSQPNRRRRAARGYWFFDPEEFTSAAARVVRDVLEGSSISSLAAVAITGMAETGLLVNRSGGEPQTPLLPWFDDNPSPQAARMAEGGLRRERFLKTGLYPNFKCALAKLLWLRDLGYPIAEDQVWLSTPDFIAYQLTGVMATDYSLAGRTYAFDLDRKTWDADWLCEFGLQEAIFPAALPSGARLSETKPGLGGEWKLPAGVPVTIAGHDHVCAAFAGGAVVPGSVFDSMGTAEALVGARSDRPLEQADLRSGLVFGCHVAPGRRYWMGGLSASGGSLDWLRGLLSDPALSYAELESLLDQAPPGPTGILYFPYLSGSGSPHTDLFVRGALAGLDASHNRSWLAKAFMEGSAYEVEVIRRAAEAALAIPVQTLSAAGGGARSSYWMQIKADVSGCQISALRMSEASLLGACLVAGLGLGLYADETQVQEVCSSLPSQVFLPDPQRSRAYRRLFEGGYLKLQEPLRAFGSLDWSVDSEG